MRLLAAACPDVLWCVEARLPRVGHIGFVAAIGFGMEYLAGVGDRLIIEFGTDGQPVRLSLTEDECALGQSPRKQKQARPL